MSFCIVVVAALGGFLFGFDSSVISGCRKAIQSEFGLRRFGMLSHSSAGATGIRKCPLIGASVACEYYLYGRGTVLVARVAF